MEGREKIGVHKALAIPKDDSARSDREERYEVPENTH